jgi:hypothetical protein
MGTNFSGEVNSHRKQKQNFFLETLSVCVWAQVTAAATPRHATPFTL